MQSISLPVIDDPILRISDVEKSVGLKKSTIYALVQKNEFPPPFKLTNGSRSSGWLLSSINTWKAERIAASRKSDSE